MATNLPLNGLIDIGRKPMRPFDDERDAKVGAALFEAFAEGAAVESSWDELLKHRVCLLVGPAHCGKTSELKLLQRRLRDQYWACFMLGLGTLVRSTVDETIGAAAWSEQYRADSRRRKCFRLCVVGPIAATRT